MTFSQRIGKSPLNKQIQLNDMDQDLRNGLWNAFKLFYCEKFRRQIESRLLGMPIWLDFFKFTMDTLPVNYDGIVNEVSYCYNKAAWNEVYDFIQFIADIQPVSAYMPKDFINYANSILERENSAYRFIDDILAPVTNEQEIASIEYSIDQTGQLSAVQGANIHLRTALEKFSDRVNADYRNSIKESISAVENVVNKINSCDNQSLGEALKKLKEKIVIHPALEQGFSKVYGYTSDGAGIRHAIMDDANCDLEDARFMLVACSAFINYLIVKSDKAGINLE
jgi:hypothetical protein